MQISIPFLLSVVLATSGISNSSPVAPANSAIPNPAPAPYFSQRWEIANTDLVLYIRPGEELAPETFNSFYADVKADVGSRPQSDDVPGFRRRDTAQNLEFLIMTFVQYLKYRQISQVVQGIKDYSDAQPEYRSISYRVDKARVGEVGYGFFGSDAVREVASNGTLTAAASAVSMTS